MMITIIIIIIIIISSVKKNKQVEKIKRKSMHGQFYRDLASLSIDKENPSHGYVPQA